MRGVSGIANMELMGGIIGIHSTKNVQHVATHIPQKHITRNTAQINAKVQIEEEKVLTMLRKIANFVARILRSIGTARRPVAQDHADYRCLGKSVKTIQKMGKADVYCMTVPRTHNFIANGMVVHNSLDALRYGIFTHFFAKEGSRMTASDLDRMYFETQGSSYILPKPFIEPEQHYMF